MIKIVSAELSTPVMYMGGCQLPGTFLSEKLFPLPQLSHFEISKIHIQLHGTHELLLYTTLRKYIYNYMAHTNYYYILLFENTHTIT